MKRTFIEPKRVPIPGLCWIPKPGDVLRCTESKDHPNRNHRHAYTREEWPRQEGETQ